MVFDTHKSSGLTIKQFCKNEGVSEAAFYAWRKKLSVKTPKPATCSKPPPPESFIQVSMPKTEPRCLELRFESGHTLSIPSDIDSKMLNNILSALRQAKLC
jgi:hypothetical protein